MQTETSLYLMAFSIIDNIGILFKFQRNQVHSQ